MILRTPKGKRPYILQSERDLAPEEQTRALIQDLSEKQKVTARNAATPTDRGDDSRGDATFVYRILKAGLIGWEEGYEPVDEDGNRVPMEFDDRKEVSDATLERIPELAKREIALAIFSGTALTEDELGKSEPSPGEAPEDASKGDQTTTSPDAPSSAEDPTLSKAS